MERSVELAVPLACELVFGMEPPGVSGFGEDFSGEEGSDAVDAGEGGAGGLNGLADLAVERGRVTVEGFDAPDPVSGGLV